MNKAEYVSWEELAKELKETGQLGKEPMRNTVKTPVRETHNDTAIAREAEQQCNFDDVPIEDDECYNEPEATNSEWEKKEGKENPVDKLKLLKEDGEKFAKQIKIDFIPSIDYRILCRFLGVTSVNEIKNHPYQTTPLITLLLMENLVEFMKERGFNFVGELNFDQRGNSIPPVKNPWIIKNKETTFTVCGFLYFEKIKGKKTDNVAFFLFTDLERGGASITCFSTNTQYSKKIVNDLQIHTKRSNCLRGAKLKDVNMLSASFSEVDTEKKYNWTNYYYPKSIKNLFELEVFDFVNNIEKYRSYGITKRGIILHGRPGGGKTTIGNIICNLMPGHTVIWITPEMLAENSYKAISSIKILYKLADFLAPCIIILEDLDLFSQDREQGGDRLSLGALMNILDGVNSIGESVTIGTTNRLATIEMALRNRPGRFDRIIEIPPLTPELRLKMFKKRLKEWRVKNGTFDYLVKKTDDWTGAEVQEFVNSLNLKHIGSRRKNKHLDQKWSDEVLETMSKYGVGEASSSFGFGKKD